MTLPEFGASAGVAFITAAVTVWLTKRRSFSEKWWERKAEIYSEIITALSHIERHAFVTLEELQTGARQPFEAKTTRDALSQKSREQIAHITSMGAFIISEDVDKHLRAFELESAQADMDTQNLHEFVSASHVAVCKALKAIRESAKKELKVGWSRWPI